MLRIRNAYVLPLLFLGFSSGLPLALTGSTLQAWFASENISIVTIGMLSLVGQPYLYKFLWAPLLDRYVPPLLGRRRGWMALMQLCLSISIALMGLGHPVSHLLFPAVIATMVAFFSATQDLAIDAYRTDILSPSERGLGAALFVTGYRIAMLVSGGLALILADKLGFRLTYFIMAGLMFLNILVTCLSPEPQKTITPYSLREAFILPLKAFFHYPSFILLFFFLVFYKMGDAYTLSLSTAFLIEHLHFSLMIVGSINKVVGLLASVFGSLAGGMLLTRLRLYPCLWFFGLGQALCSFLYMALALTGQNISLLTVTVFADNFFGGLTSVALLAFITGLCDKRFSATQFAVLSVISSIPRVFIGPLAGLSVHLMGWTYFFFLSFFFSLPGLWLLWRLRNSYDALFCLKPH